MSAIHENNMISIRRSNSRFLTYQGQNSLPKKPRRHISTETLPANFENADFRLLSEADEPRSEKPILKKQISILDQMGFSSLIDCKAEDQIDEAMLKRKFSIGITDFWADQNRETFLRSKGYLNAYNKLKKASKKKEILGNTSIRKPTLPHIMDMNVKRRIFFESSSKDKCLTTRSNFGKSEFPLLSAREGFKLQNWVDGIDSLMGKCVALSKDTIMLKKSTEFLKNKLKEDFLTPTKKKISKKDRKKIRSIVSSMDVE